MLLKAVISCQPLLPFAPGTVPLTMYGRPVVALVRFALFGLPLLLILLALFGLLLVESESLMESV